jgi:hypothetical protein
MNATVKPIPIGERMPTEDDADGASDVLWLELIEGEGGAPLWIAWSGPFDHPNDPNDKCSGVATHWAPLTIFGH